MAKPTYQVRSQVNGVTVHPGQVLYRDWMIPLELSQNELARMMHVSPRRVNEIVNGRRAITADSAVRLSECLSMSPHYWLALQADYEIDRARKRPRRTAMPAAPEPAVGNAIEPDAPRPRPPGWRRNVTPEYRELKKREAILSMYQREDLEDYE